VRHCIFAALSILSSGIYVGAATFGTVVPIGGHASDLALDESRGRLYIANFAGRRIDVMSTSTNTLGTAIPVSGTPGSIALSPDSRYLLVTNYGNCEITGTTSTPCDYLSQPTNVPELTVIDLVTNVRQTVTIPPTNNSTVKPIPPSIPLAMAFGGGTKALLVASTAIFLVDPTTTPPTFVQQAAPQVILTGAPLPTTFGTYPPEILNASTGVSGDGQTIIVLASEAADGSCTGDTPCVLLRYGVTSGSFTAIAITTTPVLGPRDVSVDQHGSNFVAGWGLYNPNFVLLAEFPYPTGSLNVGGHAYDWTHNLIYADIPSSNGAGPPVLSIAATDNLTINERINLQEDLAGRSIFSSNMNTLYAISNSGVTVFPVGSFATAHRVAAQQEQLLFLGTSCVNGPLTQTLYVYDLGGGQTDFTLSVPAGTNGITFSQSSGTTPANVTISVDPTAFQGQAGTTVVPLTIQSNGSIGIPNTVNLLINTEQPNQRGIIHSLPGKIVDLLADNPRGRIYALRQDTNQVIVLNSTNFSQLGVLRTGNTPTQMTFTRDNNYLIVGNDNSQIASVFDLNTLNASPFIVFPSGHYPRSVAVSTSSMLGLSRNAGTPPGLVDQVDFSTRTATTPSTLGIFCNTSPTCNSVANGIMIGSPSGATIFTAMNNGVVLLFDDGYQAFEAARQDLTSLAGAYGAISDTMFMAGGNLFNRSMVPDGTITGTTATSTILVANGNAFIVNGGASAAAPGALQEENITTPLPFNPVQTVEAPVTAASLTTPPVGQIGETILAFLRTAATIPSGSTIYLSVSGFTEIPATFNQPIPFPEISSVTNSANNGQTAPGSLITIRGGGLSASSGSAPGLPLPTTLDNTCATINNVPVPLISVSSSQIHAQLPYEIVGTANLVITSSGSRSGPFNFTVLPNAPAVFLSGTAGSLTNLPLIYRAANNQLVDFSNPIHPGDTLVMIATGLGQTTPAAVDGAAAPLVTLEHALVTPTVTLENTNLEVTFAGLMPGQVGTYQINAVVPHKIAAGAEVPLVIQQGSGSNAFTVRVVNP